jgi:hypothetical protein
MQPACSESRTRLVALAGGALAVLAFAGVAAADTQPVNLTAAGQAAARAAVITRSDFGGVPGWTGGAKTPSVSSSLSCRSYNPKQSDLVLIGDARTVWKNTGIELDSEAHVLKTSGMVQLDWQRSVLSPEVMPCLRSSLAKALSPSEKLLSISQVDFPAIAPYARKYRVILDVNNVRAIVDLVLVGSGQTEITLTTTAPLSTDAVVSTAEIRLATVLLGRAGK